MNLIRKSPKEAFKKLILNKTFQRIVYISIGITSTIWFLVRVIPKPQRASYPCMRASAPIMSGLVIYLIALLGSVTAFVRFKRFVANSKYLIASVFLVIALAFTLVFIGNDFKTASADNFNFTLLKTNAPLGVERGIKPGAVVWVYDSLAARWNEKGEWWEDANTSTIETNKMVSSSLKSLTGKNTEAAAWDTLFKHFNYVKKATISGYTSNQKIAIKVNQNNTDSHSNSKEINASPQLIYSLLNSLIYQAGVPQKNITVFDASRFITDNIYNKCHGSFPEVVFVDNIGGDGREKATYVEKVIHFSSDNGSLATGIATCAIEADYIIDMAVLKGHVGQGVTLCAKNFYGATSIASDWRKNFHNNFDPDPNGKPKYMTFVDYLGHKDLGEKTLLFLIDGLYATEPLNGIPKNKWKQAPFNNRWCSSLLASQDGVAIDAVGLDFLSSEFPTMPDVKYADQYLIEEALANDPPSKTFYDPEKDGVKCKSLGIVEHWNNSIDRKYSRNLGMKHGIDLIQVK